MPRLKTTEEYVHDVEKIHGNKFGYSKTDYKGNNISIIITCFLHGDVEVNPKAHLRGSGCPICANNIKLTTEQFIIKSNIIHNNKYIYIKVIYNGHMKKVCIICPEHGEFWQTPNSHLKGRGCPKCKNISNGELKIRNILNNLNIDYFEQFSFNNCKDKQVLPFDFFIPSKNLLIEYDGIQHFKSKKYFGGQKSYLIRIKHDILKNEFAKDNNIQLLRIPYWKYDNINKIILNNLKTS